MEIVQFEKEKEDEWIKCVKKGSTFATISDNPRLPLVLEKTFNWPAKRFLIKDQDEITGCCSFNAVGNTIVSLPHFSYGCFHMYKADNTLESIKQVVSLLGYQRFELRTFNNLEEKAENHKITSFLHLKNDEAEQLAYFKSKLRSQIRKGGKNNLEIVTGGILLLDDFYKVYSKNMRDLGSPVLSRSLFQNLLEMLPEEEVKLFIVRFEGKPIGASFVLSYLDFTEVCWASTLRDYNKLSTNMFLYWEMIKDAVIRNAKVFSFGRSTVGAATHKFKKQWLTDEKELFFYKNYGKQQSVNIKELTFLAQIWSKLPLKVANTLGPIFSKRIY